MFRAVQTARSRLVWEVTKFGFPFAVVTIWQFVSVPNAGATVSMGVPLDSLPLAVVTVPVFLVIQATLTTVNA